SVWPGIRPRVVITTIADSGQKSVAAWAVAGRPWPYPVSFWRKNGAGLPRALAAEWAKPTHFMRSCVAPRDDLIKLTFRSAQVPSPPSDGFDPEGGLNAEVYGRRCWPGGDGAARSRPGACRGHGEDRLDHELLRPVRRSRHHDG